MNDFLVEDYSTHSDSYTFPQLVAATKAVGTITTGIAASAPAGIAGMATLPFKGVEGAKQVIDDITQALTYVPQDEAGQAMVQRIAGMLKMLGEPAQWVGDKVNDLTGSPLAATAAEIILDPVNIATAGAAAAIKPAAKVAGKVAKKVAENAAAPVAPKVGPGAQRGAIGDTSYANVPDPLLGFRKGKPNKASDETKYKHYEFFKITQDSGRVDYDAVAGLNKQQALERAKRNWEGDIDVTPMTREEMMKLDPDLVADVDAEIAKKVGAGKTAKEGKK